MKSVLLAICLSFAICPLCFGQDNAGAPSINGDPTIHVESLPARVRQTLEKIHVGMPRKEVEKLLRQDGGLFSIGGERYYVPDFIVESKVVMITFGFQPAGMPDEVYANERLRNEWARNHDWAASDHWGDAVVRQIGKPFLSGAAID